MESFLYTSCQIEEKLKGGSLVMSTPALIKFVFGGAAL